MSIHERSLSVGGVYCTDHKQENMQKYLHLGGSGGPVRPSISHFAGALMIHGELDPFRLLWTHQSCMIDVSEETAAKPLDQDCSDESLQSSV